MKNLYWGLALLTALLAGLFIQKLINQDPIEEASAMGLIIFPQARVLSPFELVDDQQDPFTNQDLNGQWTLMFFGYTYCPDICPDTMALMNKLHQSLPENIANTTQVIMVSVDPDRDTPKRLNQYVNYYNPEFIGVTGPLTSIYPFSKELNIVFAHIKKTPEDTQYLVDHSGSIVLLDDQGRYRGFFKGRRSVDQVVRSYQLARSELDG